MSKIARGWDALASHRWAAIAAVGGLSFALAATISAVRTPVPRIHDEFSYLLAADTFAHGRLANPTHPLWQHFETFHVLQQPSYASKYPPLQGMILAVGVLLGHPIVGAWLATALAAAACTWMFQAFAPVRWALLGGVLVAFHHGVQFHWGQTYWGAALPMLGGALLFGGWVRLRRRPRPRDALALAVGVAVLANSRPFEGLVACVPVALSLLRDAWARVRAGRLGPVVRSAVPAGVLLAVVAGAMAVYNERVTGDPATLPYVVHEATYSDTPLFVWQSPRAAPEYRHEEIREFYQGWVRQWYEQQQSFARALWERAVIAPFFFTPFLAATLLASPWIFRSRKMRFAGGTAVWAFAATLALPWESRPHFVSPVAPLLVAICLQGLRQIRLWRRREALRGSQLASVLVIGHIALFVLALAGYRSAEAPAWSLEREALRAQLEQEGGRHLILVEYGDEHSVHEEWVANGADLEGGAVLWARPMDPAASARLRAHYADRRVWRLEADREPPRLQVYAEPVEWEGWPR